MLCHWPSATFGKLIVSRRGPGGATQFHFQLPPLPVATTYPALPPDVQFLFPMNDGSPVHALGLAPQTQNENVKSVSVPKLKSSGLPNATCCPSFKLIDPAPINLFAASGAGAVPFSTSGCTCGV